MAAKPKLTPEQWVDVRARWEADEREGFAWLVDELGLSVSAPGVRKKALSDGWRKVAVAAPVQKVAKVSQGAPAKVSRKVSQTLPETMPETLPVRAAEAIEREPDQFGALTQLPEKQEVFVKEYMVDWNATQAAIRAGYSANSASQIAYQLLQKPSVRDAIETLAVARARRLGVDADELMRMWAAVVSLDANELSQLRRVCCPYCWGEGHQRQYTPSGLEDAKKRHERERARRKRADAGDDIGDFPEYTDAWYDKRKAPAGDCPECHGDGVVEVFLADTRTLSPAARLVFAGVKEGKDGGIELLTMSKERAADNLARALGLFKEKETEVNINMVSGDELYHIYEDRMKQARARQALVLSERGIAEDGQGPCPPEALS